MIKNKSGFVFTFLSLFLVLIIYFFADINLQTQVYTSEDDFKESRIETIDSSLEYFKTTYLHEVYEVSLDATLQALLNESSSNPGFYNSYQNNYTQFIAYVNEGMINGTFNSVVQPSLQDKTVNDLVSSFKTSFDRRNRANFTFESYSIAIYEDDPFYISLESEFGIETELDDNLSYWKFNDSVKITRPVFEYLDPTHAVTLSQGTNAPPLESVETRYSANINWTLDILNETITNQLATTYRDPSYKYTLGNSFLQGLMGDFSGSYEHTFGFWSFDYDEEEGEVYDTSLFFENSTRLLNTKLLANLNINNGTHSPDLSDYKNNVSLEGGIVCSSGGIENFSCTFDGVDDYMTSTFDFGGKKSTDFSFSMWIKTTSSSPMALIGKTHHAFSTGSLDSNIGLEMNSSGNIGWRIEYNATGDTYYFGDKTINDGNWHHVAGIRRGGDFEIYIDGRRDLLLEKENYYINNGDWEFESGLKIGEPLHIGAYRPIADPSHFFQGEIDEIGVYDRALEEVEIARLYEANRVLNKDYVDSYHGKGIFFDGVDDEILIDTDGNYVNFFKNNDFSIEIWFTPKKESGDLLFYGDQLGISYNISAGEVYVDDNNNIQTVPTEFSQNHPNYLVITYDTSEIPPQRLKIYKEDTVLDSGSVWNPSGSAVLVDLNIGGENPNSIVNTSFGGIIDEVRIRNSTLSRSEVLENYYNFNSKAKGCCNYIIPLNPHATGFNTSAYSDLIPYSTTPFTKHHFTPETLTGITLYNVTNITSMQTDEEFYNFHVDSCQILIYDILAYDESGNAVSNVAAGTDNGNCLELVKRGIY